MLIARDLPNSFAGASFPHIEYALPITPVILKGLWLVWSVGASSLKHDHVMVWAVCCLGAFRFWRVAELTSPPLGKNFNTGVHLSLKSMALNSCSLVAWAENKLCPVEVTVVHVFLTVRGIGWVHISRWDLPFQRVASYSSASDLASCR